MFTFWPGTTWAEICDAASDRARLTVADAATLYRDRLRTLDVRTVGSMVTSVLGRLM
jgi:hypothetical protein